MNEDRKQRAHLLVQRALDDLADSLESGRSQNLQAFLEAMGRFHRYSLHNVCLITSQKPEATRVAGFQTWKTFGRSVKKGEKGIVILVPLVYRRKDQKPLVDEPEDRSLGFTTGCVFDVGQTEGLDLPEIGKVHGDPGRALVRLRLFCEKLQIELQYRDSLHGALGVSRGGLIEILSGRPPAEEFGTLSHELAHEILHRTGRAEGLDQRARELEAEAVAFAVCKGVGLDPGTACQDYIQLYRGDADLLRKSLSDVQKTAAEVLAWLDR